MDRLGITGPEKQHSIEFPGYVFCLIYSTLDTGETDSQKCQHAQTQKSLLSSASGPRKEQPSNTKKLY